MGGSPSDQKQTRAYGASRSARASKSHQTTTDGAQYGRCRFGVAENLTGNRGSGSTCRRRNGVVFSQ